MVESPFKKLDIEHDPFENEHTKADTSGERALSNDEFEALIEGARELKPDHDVRTEHAVVVMGRLGLRIGEYLHLRESWIDWKKKRIKIPAYQPCRRGKDGGLCGQCRSHAKQMARYNDVEFPEAKQLFWKAKTAKAAREVPFSFSGYIQDLLPKYFYTLDVDRIQGSQSYVGRRLKQAADKAGLGTEIRPHDLRATAANHHADTGMDVYALKSFMGWSRSDTAERYMRDSTERTQRVFNRFHTMNWEEQTR